MRRPEGRNEARADLIEMANDLRRDKSTPKFRMKHLQQVVFFLRQRREVSRNELIAAGFNPRGGV